MDPYHTSPFFAIQDLNTMDTMDTLPDGISRSGQISNLHLIVPDKH
jgi:hypothetical protein